MFFDRNVAAFFPFCMSSCCLNISFDYFMGSEAWNLVFDNVESYCSAVCVVTGALWFEQARCMSRLESWINFTGGMTERLKLLLPGCSADALFLYLFNCN